MRIIIDIRKSPLLLYEVTDEILKMNIKCILDKDEVYGYLKKSHYLEILLDKTLCVYGEQMIEHYQTYLTDGSWVWSSDINHYFFNHNFALPKDFLEYIRTLNYIPKSYNESYDDFILDKIYDSRYRLNVDIMKRKKLTF